MATKQQIIDYLKANPNLSDAELVSYMAQNQISPAQLAEASGAPVGQISAQIAATIPPNQTIQLGDTIVQPVYSQTGSGMDAQIGAIENVLTYKADENKVGGNIQYYSPTGEYQQTTKQQEVNATKDFLKFAAGAGLLFGGLGGGLDSFLGGGSPAVGNGAFLGEGVVSGIPAFDSAYTAAGGLFNPAYGLPVGNGAFLGEGIATGIPASDAAFLNAGGVFDPTFSLGADGLTGTSITTPVGVTPTTVPPVVPPTVPPVPPVVPPVPPVVPPVPPVVPPITDLTKLFGGALTSGLGLAGGLLQQQQSKDAATAAAQNVNTATQAAVAGSQFRPVGMTTRFGTSNYTYDPVTGRMTSAGYQLTPEAKAQQDRFATMANYSLTQAENAQSQFNPLQAGAANLFTLGNKYIEKTPESVAQTYIDQQMALLKPSREVELANLQNRLQQQGRLGLSVAQGGSMGATTPELQALYNARAQQEAILAANAQQAGQQSVLFGAGLLGQGTNALNQYYGGQVAAYQPYQAAMGQVQNLESLGQQPLQMGASLGQQSATAGANAGRIGLTGAQISGGLMTSPAVTNNPYAAFLSGLGSPTSTLGQGLANYITGYNPTADQNAVLNPYLNNTSSVWLG